MTAPASRLSQTALRIVRSGMKNPVLRQAETISAFDNKYDTADVPGPLGVLGGQSAILTSQINKFISSSNNFNPLRDSTRHWKDVNYRDGDEDNIPAVPWKFFKERIQDPDVVDSLQKLHAETYKKIEAIEKESQDKELQQMEEFFTGVVRNLLRYASRSLNRSVFCL